MYLHIGSGIIINSKNIIAIFNIEYVKNTKEYKNIYKELEEKNMIESVDKNKEISFILTENNKEEYLEIEEDLREAAQRYVLDNGHYPQDGNELRISSKDLYEAAYLERDDLENDGDTCEGYVVVYTENIVKYRAYIKCKNYMTENYQK